MARGQTWHGKTPEQMIEDIQDSNSETDGIVLNDWEQEFIESIGVSLGERRKLTKKQLMALEDIWDRI